MVNGSPASVAVGLVGLGVVRLKYSRLHDGRDT